MKKFIPAFYLITCGAVFGADHSETELTVIKPLVGDEIYAQQYTFHVDPESFAKEPSRSAYLFKAPGTRSTTTQKTKLKHEILGKGDILLQHEADAAMILNRFQGDFLETKMDYNKLTCKEFCDKIITIYHNAVITFYRTVEDGFEDTRGFIYKRINDEEALQEIAQRFDLRLPYNVEEALTESIKDYLGTITFL